MALDTTWIRLTSHWERADRIVGVRLDGTTTHGTGSRWIHHDARLMVRIKGEDQPWQEAATCRANRGEALEASLLNLLGEPTAGPRYIRLVRDNGRDHWTADNTMPLADTASDGVVGGMVERRSVSAAAG